MFPSRLTQQLTRLVLRRSLLRHSLRPTPQLRALPNATASRPTHLKTPPLPHHFYTTNDRPPASPPPTSAPVSDSPPSETPPSPDSSVDDANRKLHLVFTCAKCETRATKSFSKAAYQRGVVIITCPGCDARHLIADNLGWFGEERNVEQILAKKGVPAARITDNDFEHIP